MFNLYWFYILCDCIYSMNLYRVCCYICLASLHVLDVWPGCVCVLRDGGNHAGECGT